MTPHLPYQAEIQWSQSKYLLSLFSSNSALDFFLKLGILWKLFMDVGFLFDFFFKIPLFYLFLVFFFFQITSPRVLPVMNCWSDWVLFFSCYYHYFFFYKSYYHVFKAWWMEWDIMFPRHIWPSTVLGERVWLQMFGF